VLEHRHVDRIRETFSSIRPPDGVAHGHDRSRAAPDRGHEGGGMCAGPKLWDGMRLGQRVPQAIAQLGDFSGVKRPPVGGARTEDRQNYHLEAVVGPL
jgi:hypothetical protein